MSVTDIVFMVFGALLIFAGLYLFISGKKDTSSNHVEGFGIKLNVSNPSIILILSGVGLLVLPRFMPEGNTPSPQAEVNNNKTDNTKIDKSLVNDDSTINKQSPTIEKNIVAKPKTQDVPPPTIAQKNVFFPEYTWQLNSYQENGIDYNVPYQVNATMTLSNRTALKTHWATNVWVLNANGDVVSANYNGIIEFKNNSYFISFLGGSIPSFEQELDIPLEMKMEGGGILHFSYVSKNGQEVVHWVQ